MLRELWNDLTDFLFPKRCHVCGRKLGSDSDWLCPLCVAELPRCRFHRIEGNAMERRFMGVFPYESVGAYCFYASGSEFAGLVHDFKYRGFKGLARWFGKTMAGELLASGFFGDADTVMPVPVHFLKRARRGYNQSAEIATGVAEVIGSRVSGDLIAMRPHKSQTKLSRTARIDNTEGVFRLRNAANYRGRHIVLIDDVCTTGSTLTACALAVLKAQPDARLTVLALGCTV